MRGRLPGTLAPREAPTRAGRSPASDIERIQVDQGQRRRNDLSAVQGRQSKGAQDQLGLTASEASAKRPRRR
jgi:hypothetical protein